MKNIFYFLLIVLFTSCMNVEMDVRVDQSGAITYVGEVDASSMLPMLSMAMEMGEEPEEGADPIEAILKSGGAVDTVLSVFDMQPEMTDSMDITEEMKEKMKIRMQMDPDNGIFLMGILGKFENIADQKKFTQMIAATESGNGMEMGSDPETMEGFLAYAVNLEEGYIVFQKKLKEEESADDPEGFNFAGPDFGEGMDPMLNLRLTVPGKVKQVKGADFKKIDDWTVRMNLPMETTDPTREFVTVYFAPKSEFTKPEVTEVWEPKPPKVSLEGSFEVPSDATVLLGEDGLGAWTDLNGQPAQWNFADGVMTVKPGAGDIQTKESFGDCQLHIEWMTPEEPDREGQGKGNSGIFLQSRYEVQVLDSYENETYSNGQAGSIYKQAIPAVNASKAPGEWQTYDIVYKAPVFNKLGIKEEPARITVIHNGVLIHNNVAIKGTTENIGLPKNPVHGKAPLKLQDHSNKISYRNIWIRSL